MDENTISMNQTAIATPAQIEAEKMVKKLIMCNDAANIKESLHTMFIDHIALLKEEEQELDSEIFGNYYLLYHFLMKLIKYEEEYIEHETTTKNA